VKAELVAAPKVARRLGAGSNVVLGTTTKGLARNRGLSVRAAKAAVRRRLAAPGRISLLLRVTVRDRQTNAAIVRRSVRL
jgi:hypothetical protein